MNHLLIACLSIFALTAAAATDHPNIIYILADDLGYGDVSSYNPESKIATPRIDRLASQGMRFTDAHSPSSVCTPTRYSILTGRYPWRSSLKKGVSWSYGPVFMEEGRETVATMLRDNGYHTAVIGKWHLGLDWQLKEGHSLEDAVTDRDPAGGAIKDIDPNFIDFSKPVTRGPADFGFDYSYILPASLDIPPYCYLENQRLVAPLSETTEGNDLDKGFMGAFWREGLMAEGFDFYDVLPGFTRKAVNFIEQQAGKDKPFFLYLPLPAPHTPWAPTEEFNGSSAAGRYGDFVQMVDAQVGKVLDALDAQGLAENTIVIFTSDNGPYWIPRDAHRYGHRAAAHFRGMKGDIWEGGHRVPFIVRWPGKIRQGAKSAATTSLTHFIATCADILNLPEPVVEDSYSILPVLLEETSEAPGQPGIVMHSSNAHFAWREGDWKYIEKRGSGGFSSPVTFDVRMGEPTAQLYNLAADPSESHNLFFHHPDRVKAMQEALEVVISCE